MRIEGPRRTDTKSVSKTAKTNSASGASFSAHLSAPSSEDSSVSSFGGVSGVVGIDALISVQGAEDSVERGPRSRMVERADSILDELENLRRSLVLGELTVGQLENLSARASVQRENLTDPHLIEIIDEIDMRAQIELAKFGR